MNLTARVLVLAALLATAAQAQTDQTPAAAQWAERRLTLPIVGSGTAYVPKADAPPVVLFLSGDGGWNLGVVDMARRMAPRALVIGISYPTLRKEAAAATSCWYPAGDLEIISRAAQKQLRLAEYRPPILAGYSSGAALVYAALAAAPPTTFAGGLSLGFCPELPTDRPVCAAGSWRPPYDAKKHISQLPATESLQQDWHILQGVQDEVCPLPATEAFLQKVPRAHLSSIGGTGHGFARTARWAPAFDQSLASLIAATAPPPPPAPAAPAVATLVRALDNLGLPLVYDWADAPRAVVTFVSGDGGWAALDAGLARVLAARHVSVVGLNSLRYFWQARDRAQVASVLRRVAETLGAEGLPVFVGGYSFGASVVPLAAADWTPAERDALAGLILVSPLSSAKFEVSPLDWIRDPRGDAATRVAPAIRVLSRPTLCLAGSDETEGACFDAATLPGVKVERLPGSHHYRGDYARLGGVVADFIDAQLARRRENSSRTGAGR